MAESNKGCVAVSSDSKYIDFLFSYRKIVIFTELYLGDASSSNKDLLRLQKLGYNAIKIIGTGSYSEVMVYILPPFKYS